MSIELNTRRLSQPVDSKTANQVPLVSVVIPIRNEARYIGDTLEQVLSQQTTYLDTPNDWQSLRIERKIEFEVLVVDGQSTDQTKEIVAEIAAKNKQVKLLDNQKRLSSAARNIGIQYSAGEFIVIIDGHCEIPSQTYLVDLVQAFERTGADCLGRPQPLDVSNASNLQKAIAAARNSRLGHHPDSFIYSKTELRVPAISVAVAYRREVFDQVGQFDTRFDACEDCEFNHRIDKAGLTCFLIPELAIRYQPRTSLRGLFYQLTRYGRGRIRLFRKHADAISISALIPALFLLGVVVGPMASLLVPVLWYVYFSIIAIYLSSLVLFSIKAAIDSRKLSIAAWMPAVFIAIHMGSGWGAITQTISGLWSDAKGELEQVGAS